MARRARDRGGTQRDRRADSERPYRRRHGADKRQLAAELVVDGADPDLATGLRDATHGAGVYDALDFVGENTTSRWRSARRARSAKKLPDRSRRKHSAPEHARQRAIRGPFECTTWGTIKELCEVVALGETGGLALGEIETAQFERINDIACVSPMAKSPAARSITP